MVWVRERHGDDAIDNELVRLPVDGSAAPVVIASGHDFYSTPRFSPDGTRLAFLAWDQPNMPWDGTEVLVADVRADGSLGEPRVVAGGPDESIFQPEWSPDGVLHFVSDRTGWWNLHRDEPGGARNLAPRAEEFGSPQEGNFSLKIRGSATVNTLFARLFGQSAITFSASTEVLWGIKKLNLALVLDNTGSMAQNQKMTNLKAAAHNLLTTLKNAAKQPGDVKVAIVPFATDVNVGTSNDNASWIDWTDWEAANGTCSNNTYTSKSTCESHGKT